MTEVNELSETPPDPPTLRVDVWSDIACPWCYVGKRRLEAALERFPHREAVEVRWRAFELDPSAPRTFDPEVDYAQRLAHKYATSIASARTMIRNMVDTAAAHGLAFDFDRIRPGNTFDAHRLVHLATERGHGDAAKERFLRTYMSEGAAIGEPEVLCRLAIEVGLDPDEVRATLDGDGYADAVRAEEVRAMELGIRGVPFFVFGGRFGASGAQPPDLLLKALTKAWADRPAMLAPAGPICGPDGCD